MFQPQSILVGVCLKKHKWFGRGSEWNHHEPKHPSATDGRGKFWLFACVLKKKQKNKQKTQMQIQPLFYLELRHETFCLCSLHVLYIVHISFSHLLSNRPPGPRTQQSHLSSSLNLTRKNALLRHPPPTPSPPQGKVSTATIGASGKPFSVVSEGKSSQMLICEPSFHPSLVR